MPQDKKEVFMQSKKHNIIYENWKVYSKKHKLMFRCNEKKAQWYLKRDLAIVLPKEPRSIKLTFEARGDGFKEGDYMAEDRENICVICGDNKNLTMHHVVPEMYRRWMPLVIKSKSSRDILSVCKVCHDSYERHGTNLKKECEKRFDIPMEGYGWVSYPHYRVAKRAAAALIRSSDKIPLDRQQVLKNTIQEFWTEHGSTINKELDSDNEFIEDTWENILQKCTTLQDTFKGPDYIEHGNKVLNRLTEKCIYNEENQERWPDLENFIKEWRQHFLDHAKPNFLSKAWRVDSDIYVRSTTAASQLTGKK